MIGKLRRETTSWCLSDYWVGEEVKSVSYLVSSKKSQTCVFLVGHNYCIHSIIVYTHSIIVYTHLSFRFFNRDLVFTGIILQLERTHPGQRHDILSDFNYSKRPESLEKPEQLQTLPYNGQASYVQYAYNTQYAWFYKYMFATRIS